MKLKVAATQEGGSPPAVDYRWDGQTGILSARFMRAHNGHQSPAASAEGLVEIAGNDGSWLHLETHAGRLEGMEIAIWPEFDVDSAQRPPEMSEGYADVQLQVEEQAAKSGVIALTTNVRAIPCSSGQLMRLRFGSSRLHTLLRAADNLLVGTDRQGRLAEIWMLRVPKEVYEMVREGAW